MEALLLLVVLPLVAALGVYALLRRNGRRPIVAGCVALLLGVTATLVLAAVVTVRQLT